MVLIQQISPEETYDLRHSVLWPNKPRNYVKVENDAEGYHYGAFENGELVAVISLFVSGNIGRFRKFATRPDCQGQGIGTTLLNHTLTEAHRLGATSLWCDARLSAASFYQRFGMQAEGDVFYKGDIPYSKYSVMLQAHYQQKPTV